MSSDRKAYIGAKIVQAEPKKDIGGREGYKVIYPDGYISWSPKGVFEQAYREVSRGEAELLTEVPP